MIEWSLFAESWPSYASGLWLTLQLTALHLHTKDCCTYLIGHYRARPDLTSEM